MAMGIASKDGTKAKVVRTAIRYRIEVILWRVGGLALGIRRVLWPAAAIALFMPPPAFGQFKPQTLIQDSESIEIHADVIPPEAVSEPLGSPDPASPDDARLRLKFRGGLTLRSSHPQFGGFSGLHVWPEDNRMLAISDAGLTLSGTITANADGAPASIRDALLSPFFARRDQPVSSHRHVDAEAVAVEGGRATVMFEQGSSLTQFRHDRRKTTGIIREIGLPQGVKRFRGNSGYEAIGFFGREGRSRLVLLASRRDSSGHYPMWILSDRKPARVYLQASAALRPTDIAILPSGHALVLERGWALVSGFVSQIRLIHLEQSEPGQIHTGEILWQSDPAAIADNFEGLAWHVEAARTGIEGAEIYVLTLISDDNFNPFQKTLLFQFTLDRQALDSWLPSTPDRHYVHLPTRRPRARPTRRPHPIAKPRS